jgi:hypothetical protein
MRIKLEPRSVDSAARGSGVSSTSSTSTGAVDSDDKWSKVFSKNKQSNPPPQQQQQQPTRSEESQNAFHDLRSHDNSNMNTRPSVAKTSSSTNQINASSTTGTKASDKENVIKQQAAEQVKVSVNLDAEKRKLEKEAAQLKSKQLAEEQMLLDEKMLSLSQELLNSELKGESIKEYAEKMETKPTAAAFISAVFKREISNEISVSWLNDSEYGIVVKYLVGKIADKVNFLFAVQEYCHNLKFPKIDVKGSPRNLIEVIFQLLFKKEIIDDAAFLAWADDERDSSGRVNAIVQTTNFIQLLTEEDEEDFEEEEDVDRPREIVK